MSGREVSSRCAIFSCYNYRIKGDRKSFYRFPRNIEICKQWVMRSGRVDLEQKFRTDGPESLHRRYTVCSDHFIEKDFRNKNLLRHGIFPGSVPSVLVDTKENNSMPSLKREEEVGQNESVPGIQMLEVPVHFQKPHEIFISEQADRSSENSAQEETDPLCLKEEPIDGSAVGASDRTQNAPVSESDASIATAEGEASMPKGDAGDTGPGTAVRHCDSTAASPAQKASGDAEEATDPRVLCPSHERKKVSHSQMVTLAIMDAPDWQLPFREICRYIASNFLWVRSRASWCHSIRDTMYKSPLFVKTRDTNTHRTWTVVAAYAGMLRRSAGPSCCRWKRVRWLRVRRPYSPRSAGVDRFGPKRPRESWLQPVSFHRNHKSHADYPLPDKPVEVSDELDIKEEPFPEEPLTENICMEENGDKRQSVCATLLDGDCSGTVRMKQEKEEYPDTAKHGVADTS